MLPVILVVALGLMVESLPSSAAQDGGSWGCRTKPGGGWDCSWSGSGPPPTPQVRRRPKPAPTAEPAEAEPPSSAAVAEPSPRLETQAEPRPVPVPELSQPERASQGVTPVPNTPAPARTAEVPPSGEGAGTPAAPAAAPEPKAPEDGGFAPWRGIKRWFGASGEAEPPSAPPAAEPRPVAPSAPAGAGLEDLQPGPAIARPKGETPQVAPRAEEPAPAAAPPPSPGFAPVTTLKRWVGWGDDQAKAPSAQQVPVDLSKRIEPPGPAQAAPSAYQPPRAAASTVTAGSGVMLHGIQLVSASDRGGLDRLIEEHGMQAQAWVFQEQRNGRPWYSLLYGRYETLDQAMEALSQLPPALKRHDPWVRKVEISP